MTPTQKEKENNFAHPQVATDCEAFQDRQSGDNGTVAILEPGRKRRRRPTRQVVIGTLWGVALALGLLIVVGELI